MADYLFKEMAGADDARRVCRQWLRNYATLVAPEVDFPPSRFRSRTDPVTRVVGYDKSATAFRSIAQSPRPGAQSVHCGRNDLRHRRTLHRLFARRYRGKDRGAPPSVFQDRVKAALSLRNRGVQSANFFVLRKAKMPSILLEPGFMAHPDEEALLRRPEVLDGISAAVVKGVA